LQLPLVLGRELVDEWRDVAAGTPPGRPEVHQHRLPGAQHFGLEVVVGEGHNVRARHSLCSFCPNHGELYDLPPDRPPVHHLAPARLHWYQSMGSRARHTMIEARRGCAAPPWLTTSSYPSPYSTNGRSRGASRWTATCSPSWASKRVSRSPARSASSRWRRARTTPACSRRSRPPTR